MHLLPPSPPLLPLLYPSLTCRRSEKLYSTLPCLGRRRIVNGQALPFEFMTYGETAKVVKSVSSALVGLGLNPKDRVGIIGQNSPEWMMAMQVRMSKHK